MRFRLRDADTTLKLFLSTFLLVLTIGYMVGLFFVGHSTSMSSQGIQEQFLGNDESDTTTELRYAKSVNEMYIFMHNHILSLSLVFLALGGIFYFSSLVSDGVKRFLIVEPLVAVVTTFGGIALVRFVSPYFSWLVFISGVSLFVSYVVTVFLIVKELWFSHKKSPET